MDQFSLFDMGTEDVKAEEQKEEKEQNEATNEAPKAVATKLASSAKSTTKKPKAPVKKEEPVKVDDTWTIHYATHTFMPSDFLTIPAGGVELEPLRVEMEKEFFEMTKARTKWDLDKENKRLFPDISGTSKGVFSCYLD